jgi:AbrB family looped-hinge helix DNA binding protein
MRKTASHFRMALLKGMTLKIDGAGRVVLPKPVRDRLGLRAGSEFEIEETPEGVVLRPVDRHPSLVRKGRFWVHTGQLPAGYDVVRAIDDDREERARKAWGL